MSLKSGIFSITIYNSSLGDCMMFLYEKYLQEFGDGIKTVYLKQNGVF